MSGISFDGRDYKSFAMALRKQAPELEKRMRKRISTAGRIAAKKMKAQVPHPDSGAQKGVRWSDSLSSKGGAIVIGGNKTPQSYAYAFGVGQPGRIGHYKHPVFGKWSGSEKTVMPISDYVEKGWAEVGTWLMLSAEEAVDETLQELAFGGGSVESDLR